MKLKSIIRRCVPSRIYTFASKCKVPFIIAHTQAENKQKLRGDWGNNSTIKIVFIVQRTEVFNSVRTVFEAAVKNDRCEAYLLPLPRCRNDSRELRWETYDSVVDFCRELGAGIVIESYDRKMNKFNDLGQLKPDYVFLNVPYTSQYPDEYSMDKLVSITKVCYIPYGYAVSEYKRFERIYSISFGITLLSNAEFLFADGDVTYNYCKKSMWLSELIYGKRLYNIGFPRFETISSNNVKNKRYVALWIPRWTDEKQTGMGRTTFFRFKDLIIDYTVGNNEYFDLIIRPHPLAFENYIKDGKMSKEEVNQYKAKLETNNILLDEKPSYMEALSQADVLIADFSSIIIEFFMKGKPIIYCGEKEEFSPYMKQVTDTFYYVRDWKEVQSILNQLRDGNDPMAKKRKKAVELFKKISCNNAGERILQVLIEDYRFSGMGDKTNVGTK
jgi:hypothetical protein